MKKWCTLVALLCIFLWKAQSQVEAALLTATEGDAYATIEKVGFGIEAPDRSRDHAKKPTKHIKTVYDEKLKKQVFAFTIHAQIDDDRGLKHITDRQRLEIKTYDKSPKELVAKEGESFVYRWKMKLPKGFQTTGKFCHLHQLKGMDNRERTADVKHPLITFTACTKKNGTQKLELRTFDRQSRKMTVKASMDLGDITGEWVEITEKVTFGFNEKKGQNGSYHLDMIRLKDGKKLLTIDSKNLDLWQTDSSGLRPKWGIYRSLGEKRSLEKILRDEEVRFADFSIEKLAP